MGRSLLGESKKDIWDLVDRSTQQEQQQPTTEQSPSTMEGNSVRKMNYPCINASAASVMTPPRSTPTPRPHPPIVLLIFVGIIFGIVFGKYVFGYVNEIINQGSQTSPDENECELELYFKSVENESINVNCEFDFGALSPTSSPTPSPTSNPTPAPHPRPFYFNGILFGYVIVNNGYDLCEILINVNENENEL